MNVPKMYVVLKIYAAESEYKCSIWFKVFYSMDVDNVLCM